MKPNGWSRPASMNHEHNVEDAMFRSTVRWRGFVHVLARPPPRFHEKGPVSTLRRTLGVETRFGSLPVSLARLTDFTSRGPVLVPPRGSIPEASAADSTTTLPAPHPRPSSP